TPPTQLAGSLQLDEVVLRPVQVSVEAAAGRAKLTTLVPQSAAGLLGSPTGLSGVVGNASSSAKWLVAQKFPLESTLMPLRSPARWLTAKAGPKSSYTCWPAWARTGASIVPLGSEVVRPVTYIDIKSLGSSVPD